MATRIGQSIAQDRLHLGMSQQDLAKRLGVTQQSISKWEDGLATPRGKRLTALAQALGKNSQTARQCAAMLRDRTTQSLPEMDQTVTHNTEHALHTLAQAAQDLARAAEAIAVSVQSLAKKPDSKPPDRKH